MGLKIKYIPLSLKEAKEFVGKYHRHNKPPVGHKFSIGIEMDGELIAVGIAGRPVARALDNGRTIEITRLCVKEGYPNINSRLYNRIRKICELMGYESIITYTLERESGSSLKALSAVPTKVRKHKANGWANRKGREEQKVVAEQKIRWELKRNSRD